jgi:serine/threonine protein kinase
MALNPFVVGTDVPYTKGRFLGEVRLTLSHIGCCVPILFQLELHFPSYGFIYIESDVSIQVFFTSLCFPHCLLGCFAKCYEITVTKTGNVYAGKIVSKRLMTKLDYKDKLTQEIAIHRSLNHKNVVGFHRFFEDNQNVYIVLDLCRRMVCILNLLELIFFTCALLY